MTDQPQPTADGKCAAIRGNRPPCRRPAGWGTTHPGIGRCKLHGGSTPNHQRAAQLELARRECNRLGVPIEVDPGEALMQELWETAGNVAFYRSLVAELPIHPEDDTYVPPQSDDATGYWDRGEPGIYGRTYHVSGIPTGEAKPHILLDLYNQERKHFADVAAAALRAGIERRRIELAEQQGELVNQLIRGILGELGVLERPEVPAIVRKHLALVAGGAAG